MITETIDTTPQHGEYRNKQRVRFSDTKDFVTSDGQPLTIEYVSSEYTTYERYCAECEDWYSPTTGLGALMGHMCCLKCGADF